MSVMITKRIPFSNAKYSAIVNAIFCVAPCSMAGSPAKFRTLLNGQSPCFTEVFHEVFRFVEGNPHCSKYYRESLFNTVVDVRFGPTLFVRALDQRMVIFVHEQEQTAGQSQKSLFDKFIRIVTEN